jgi:hypothetical protein
MDISERISWSWRTTTVTSDNRLGYRLDDQGSVPSRVEYFLLHNIQTGSVAQPASYPLDTTVLSLEVKRLRCEANRSFPSSVQVKNTWTYTSTAHMYTLHGAQLNTRTTYLLLLLLLLKFLLQKRYSVATRPCGCLMMDISCCMQHLMTHWWRNSASHGLLYKMRENFTQRYAAYVTPRLNYYI